MAARLVRRPPRRTSSWILTASLPDFRYHLPMRILCLLFASIVFAHAQVSPEGMQCHERTLVLFVFGPNKDKQKELAPPHMDYMSRQMREGKIIAAGPFAGNDGAAIVFASSDWTEVQDILKDEPFTSAGVIKVTDHKIWNACQAIGARLSPAGQ
jgi:uncharacterized protein